MARVEAVLADVERRLGDSFGNALDARLTQMAAPALRAVDLLQASMRVALGSEETIELDTLTRDREEAERLKGRLALLAHSIA